MSSRDDELACENKEFLEKTPSKQDVGTWAEWDKELVIIVHRLEVVRKSCFLAVRV